MTLDLSLIVKIAFERLMSFNIFKLIKIPMSLKNAFSPISTMRTPLPYIKIRMHFQLEMVYHFI